ncbi:MAG: type IV toxin-antitoxin system AbiEi family antitoxin domain-containing protein [Acidimicrobiia bacterium]
MRRADLLIANAAVDQHALATRRQLLKAGVSEDQIDDRLQAGLLIRVHSGVYRLAGAEETYVQRVMAACLASGGVASHRCAARLFGLRGCWTELVEVTVEGPRAPALEGVLVHRTKRLERTAIGVIPVTVPGRIAVDLAAVAPRLVGGALADLLVRVTTLRSVADAVIAAGRTPGIRLVRQELDGYLAGKQPTESALEDAFVKLLARHGIPEPERQYQPPWEPHRRVDFARPADRLLIELDGRLWHSSAADRERDRAKDERAAAHGFATVRITWVDVHDTPARVLECLEIKRAA